MAVACVALDHVQPFWAIPLLGVARLEFRDILGHEILNRCLMARASPAAASAVGSDGDLVVFDPERETTLSAKTLP